MPMSAKFGTQLLPRLDKIAAKFGTPFHIYDEQGIVDAVKGMYSAFADHGMAGFRNYFSVKANPNPELMKIIVEAAGQESGFDCSSMPELSLSRRFVSGDRIMFSSNNTSSAEFAAALDQGGCILNIDDITMLDRLSQAELQGAAAVSFRYNPGSERSGDSIIGQPEEAKYGLRKDQLPAAYQRLLDLGVKRESIGIHTMIISNQREKSYMMETVKMMLDIAGEFLFRHQLKFRFINIGGGIGIPYRTNDSPFELYGFSCSAGQELRNFQEKFGYQPKLFMECGRFVTGPHGVLVTSVLNRMSKHKEYVGVDACMSSLMRPAMYDAYHHITVLGKGEDSPRETVDVVGSLCENNDKFAKNRHLPKTTLNDILIIHDTGAHGHAMGFNYNGRVRPKELLLKPNGSVVLIRRAETEEDYFRTLSFEPMTWSEQPTRESEAA
ncbi:MAG: diaminopimelate decarboxylase [Candidatus Komeilibacteria bacterium]|nr:diaminopimelate decarboxylase [Candidatus Komeilibacteria bacterium]